MKISTPKECPKKRRRKKALIKIRSKLRYTEEKLLERAKEMVNLKKRRERMAKRKQVIVNMEARKIQKTKRGHQRTIPNISQRRHYKPHWMLQKNKTSLTAVTWSDQIDLSWIKPYNDVATRQGGCHLSEYTYIGSDSNNGQG